MRSVNRVGALAFSITGSEVLALRNGTAAKIMRAIAAEVQTALLSSGRARVILQLTIFVKERDYKFAAAAAVVLVIIIAGFAVGIPSN
jgi:hypothetical protein